MIKEQDVKQPKIKNTAPASESKPGWQALVRRHIQSKAKTCKRCQSKLRQVFRPRKASQAAQVENTAVKVDLDAQDAVKQEKEHCELQLPSPLPPPPEPAPVSHPSPASNPDVLCLAMFDVGKPLGRGRFGSVFMARDRISQFVCALKVLKRRQLRESNMEKQVRREITIQSKLRHPNILKLHGQFQDISHIFLVLEYAPHGGLHGYLREVGRLSEPSTAPYIAQVAGALRYLHRHQIVHRDVKPENILLGVRGELKLSDFGWSVHSTSNGDRGSLGMSLYGTVDYLPPEMIGTSDDEECRDDKIDNWSLGVLIFELLVGEAPFASNMPSITAKKIATGDLTIPSFVSAEATDLVSKLLAVEPRDRLSLAGVQEHPWISKYCRRGMG